MFLGQRVFNRGSDIREYRLYLLIKHAFSQKIPSEQEVCKLFQCTASSSRSLIRAVMSKYQYLLKDAIHGTLRDYLGKAKVNGQDASAVLAIDNRNIVEQLNRTLSEMDSSLPPVQKKRASVSTYEMKLSSYYRLCEHFGLAQK